MFVSATGLIAAWWAYKRRFIEFRDLRVWLACHELVAKRCSMETGRVPRFSPAELLRLVDCPAEEHVRASIRRLSKAGLLGWSVTKLRFVQSTAEVTVGAAEDLQATLKRVTNNRRRVPVPRRFLMHLCGTKSPVALATALGHLLRCSYYRALECRSRGLCKASWIAETFEVDERNVKAARGELVRLGILIREPTPQRVMNRFGAAVIVNLVWEGARCERPPLRVQSTTQSPPPRETGNSLSRVENQKPGVPNLDGVRIRTRGAPTFKHVELVDLKEPDRLMFLARCWAKSRRRAMSASDEIRVFAAAKHALRVGKKNPCGLFATMLRSEQWGYITLGDEDAGREARRQMALVDNAHSGAEQLQRIQGLVRSAAEARSMKPLRRDIALD